MIPKDITARRRAAAMKGARTRKRLAEARKAQLSDRPTQTVRETRETSERRKALADALEPKIRI